MLAVTDLIKRYGGTVALHGVSLEVEPGSLFGLLGPNGAGKSTLVKIACGLVRPSSGAATIDGAPATDPEARRRLGYLAELFRFPEWCSPDEVLALHQRLAGSGAGAPERARLLDLVGLADVGARKVGEMSKGMQQRLGLAQALIGSPRIVLLDEPTSALDPAGRRLVRGVLEQLRSEGVSVLLNSHLLSEVELVCDRVAIINHGRLVTEGTPGELSRPRGVEIVTASGTRLIERAGREEVPQIVRDLVGAGEEVFEVRLLRSTLEDAYLEAVA
jgi:ABC-2 type transport system ATP-binding protein